MKRRVVSPAWLLPYGWPWAWLWNEYLGWRVWLIGWWVRARQRRLVRLAARTQDFQYHLDFPGDVERPRP